MLKHQVYISASKNDPCSNSLIEALELKLPSIVLKSGVSHRTIKQKRFIFYKSKRSLI